MPVAPGVGEASTGRPRPRRPPAAPSTLPGSGHHGHHPAAGQRACASGLLPGQGAGRVLLGPEPRGREELQPCLGWGEEEGGTHGPMAPLSLCHEPEEKAGRGAGSRQEAVEACFRQECESSREGACGGPMLPRPVEG